MGRRHYRREDNHAEYPPRKVVMNIVQSPWLRMEDSPNWGRLWAIPAAFLQWAMADIFTGILALVVVTTFADWYYGRKVAEASGKYDPAVAVYGIHSKLAGLLVILLVRGFEAWLVSVNAGLETRGLIATGVAVLLFAQDVESIAYHRRMLGAEPMPGLSQVIAFLRRTGRIFLPESLHDDPEEHENNRRRRTDLEDESDA